MLTWGRNLNKKNVCKIESYSCQTKIQTKIVQEAIKINKYICSNKLGLKKYSKLKKARETYLL